MSVAMDFLFFVHVFLMETLEILLEWGNVTEHQVGFLLFLAAKEHGAFQMFRRATIHRNAALLHVNNNNVQTPVWAATAVAALVL